MAAITVVGTGYVGLATAVCLAELGHQVTGLDIDAEKIGKLRQGVSPIYEPGLVDLLGRGMAAGRLSFTTDYGEAVPGAEFVFIAVATPMGRRGDADIVFVKQAAQSIAKAMRAPLTIVNKSTVPIGTGDIISRIVHENLGTEIPFQVICNPEFLREGTAIQDFMHPDRLVLGAHDRAAAEAVAAVYERLDAPVLFTDLYTAEMIKYASNAFLATRISFINEIARICERVDADVKVVAEGMGMDRRIGPMFLEAGIGYGGSCFPKDVKALARMAETMGYHPELLDTVMEINEDQRKLVVDKLREVLGSLRDQTIGVLGLAYKPNTDDIREAPAMAVIQSLLEKGAHVRAYDPAAIPNAKRLLNSSVEYCEDAYATARGADALLLVTEWDEFRRLDFDRIKPVMRRPVLVDGRNIYDPRAMRDRGFIYRGVGR
jgi:UDPglucose 6-dehydrogenase